MYKIEIWSYHEKIDEYENNNIQKILQWFIDKGYKMLDEYGECCFCVFNDNKELSFEEKDKLGFFR